MFGLACGELASGCAAGSLAVAWDRVSGEDESPFGFPANSA